MSSLTLGKYIPILETIRGYKKENLRKDLIAALTVTVVGIPQYMAYALIAGVSPVYGLYTGIVAAIIGSAFGCSNQLITGPTNAICLITASAMIRYMGLPNAYQMLFLMTFLVGVLQIIYGVIKLGKVIDFVSHTVLIGFTAGAGILIALGQVNTLLSISIKNSAEMSTMEKMYYIITHINQTNYYALGLGVMTMAIIVICRKISKNLPGALIGITVPIFFIIVFALEKKGVKLTGTIPSALPPFKMVEFSLTSAKNIFSGAFAISIIGLVEAISISKAISTNTRQKIDSNQEFIGQGISNIVASFFQCFPSSGSFSRSAINYVNGATSRFSGILSGVFVALVLLFFAPYAKYIPSPCLAGVLIVTGYNLIDQKEIKKVVKAGLFSSDSIAMWVTAVLVIVLLNLDYAIYAGIALSIVLYLKDTNKAPIKFLIPSQGKDSQIIEHEVKSVNNSVDVLVIQLEGNLYFGAASDLGEKLESIVTKSKVFILRMKYVTTIDLTSLSALTVFIRNVREAGGTIIISGVKSDFDLMLKKSNLDTVIGLDNIFMSENDVFASSTNALERARTALTFVDNANKLAAGYN
ncbi:putative sulfate:proton symporter (anion:anion symporter or antiporter of the sulfate permease SulP family) [Candidatus Desulfosporosinus infrequens]|uniref:Putative sulfate:proton symporter (Anion:anion symporter or antiporter of the sulfate permease SulP family) n=1 Tax=Candidatus Desulfosporosinus infrequens TaxID=2043169 RepID=A0A2U3LF80_9FIRM|nr:putative sulfate:proton symporter (anion:anion symporter or antiporter of the sulfate permease SulP family) [Candidatus Desulfosporosinus infrequens]